MSPKYLYSGAKHVLSLMAQGQEPKRPLATKDFLWAIKQMPKAPLIYSYKDILETFRKLDSEQRNQFADMKKDIAFYVRKASKYKLSKCLQNIFIAVYEWSFGHLLYGPKEILCG